MRILCYDNLDCNELFIFEASAIFYEPELPGLVVEPVCSAFSTFCFVNVSLGSCNLIVTELYENGFVDLRSYGPVELLGDYMDDIVTELYENGFIDLRSYGPVELLGDYMDDIEIEE